MSTMTFIVRILLCYVNTTVIVSSVFFIAAAVHYHLILFQALICIREGMHTGMIVCVYVYMYLYTTSASVAKGIQAFGVSASLHSVLRTRGQPFGSSSTSASARRRQSGRGLAVHC